MPSKEHLEMKQEIVEEIKGKIEKAQSAIIINYMGITVEEANAMRKKLRDAGVDYTVYKNTMTRRAVKDTPFSELEQILTGPNAIAFGYEDAAAPAKVLAGVMKEMKKMEFKGGIVEGNYFDAAGIQTIAALPGREELIAKFLGSINSPLGKLVRTFQAVADAKEA